ncbi:MAG TPA: ABC transporter permease, partial [Ktedonobacteraceae bacterium]|nr:ABC transporter permease [Ktedonobacteraceae bacterium]
AQRQKAIQSNVIPAIVDAYTLNRLSLHVEASFTMHEENAPVNNITFTVVAVVQHIPSINNSLTINDSSAKPLPGGVMVDYQSYTDVQQHLFGTSIPAEHVWLRTQRTSAALAKVRTALDTPRLHLDNLYDRSAINDALGSDPLYLNLLVVLMLGACTALLLAVIGDMLASWLSVRTRLTQFALLRAQGASHRQVVSVLLWEQGIVYTTALLLGSLFGAVLAVTVVPVLVFTSVPVSGKLSTLSNAEFYVLQQAVTPRIVLPFSLVIAFIVLVAICLLALFMMARVALHPSMSQVLRLDED